MTILRDSGIVFVECDSCGNLEELDLPAGGDSRDFRDAIRNAGFSVSFSKGNWTHNCAECDHVS